MYNSLYNNEKCLYIFIVGKYISLIFISLIIRIILKQINILNSKISVIIPTYNRAKLIGNSIKSVLNQTYKNLEVIIVDDVSTDNTKEIINKIEDNRIKYIKLRKKGGAANARNKGIKIAKGKYIAFQDSDDIFYPNKLENQLKTIIKKDSDLDFCKIKYIAVNRKSYFEPNIRQEKSIFSGKIYEEIISNGNFISTPSMLVKKNIIMEYYFDSNLPMFQDYELILRMFPKVKISYTNEVLLELHKQKDSITRSKDRRIKGIELLLKKNFNFNTNQKQLLINYLKKKYNSLIS